MSCVKMGNIRQTKYSWQEPKFWKYPCNHCQNCIRRRQGQLEFLAKRELIDRYKQGQGASFVTFTYENGYVPKSKYTGKMTLRRKDLQDFNKRIRENFSRSKLNHDFKLIYCGEYGDNYGRPHYHVAYIGLTDKEIEMLSKKCWNYGIVDIGTLGNGGLRYILDYFGKQTIYTMTDKIIMEQNDEQPPFLYHSINLGKDWILRNTEKIIDEKFTFIYNKKRQFLPKYVMQWVSEKTGVDYRPYVLQKMHEKGDNWQDLQLEESILKEKWLIEGARSKGINVTPTWLASRHWCKPKSHRLLTNWKPLIENTL